MQRSRSVCLALLMFSAVLLPLVTPVSADDETTDIALSSSHEMLLPGSAVNVSVTVTNDNIWSTRSYNLSLDSNWLPPQWNLTLVDTSLGPVLPTASDSTTLVIRLDAGAPLGANGNITITATRTDDANESSSVTLYLSVAPRYMPALDVGSVGDRGLVTLDPNQTVDVDIPVANEGNIEDTIILQIDEAVDLNDFWANWNSSQSNNSGGNNSCNNCTGGNNTGNNSGGNQSCGNCSGGGNNTGNNTGNNSGGNQSCGNCSGGGNNSGNESNGTSMRGPARTLPADWEVRWLDPIATNMAPSEVRNQTLRISVPADAGPEYRGIALFAGSVGGNFSIQTIIVVEVTTVSDIVVQVVHDANRTYLPAITEVVDFTVTNNGNSETSLIYSTSSDSTCSAIVAQTVGSELTPLASETISLNITPDESTHWNDTCTISIFAEESSTGVSHQTDYTIVVGVDWGWEITPPENTSVSAGASTQVQISVRNIGSELDEVRFDVTGPSGVSGAGPPGWMSVDRGLADAISVQVDVDSDVTLVGLHNLTLTATGRHGGQQVVTSISIDIQPRQELTISAPQGGSVLVAAGSSSNFSLMLTNSGTENLSVGLDWSGLPSSLTLQPDALPVEVGVGQVVALSVTLFAASDAVAQTHNVEFYGLDADDSSTLSSVSVQIEVGHSPAVRLLASGAEVPVGEHSDSTFDVVVVNDGNQQDQFSFELTPSSGFEVTIEPLLMTLDAGAQDSVSVTLRRTSATGDTSLSLVASSSNDPAVSSSYDFTATEVTLGVTVALSSSVTEAAVGDPVSATLWLTNTGNANQTFSLSAHGLSCPNLPPTYSLAPSSAATPLALDCTVPANTAAGNAVLTASATSVNDVAVTDSASLNISVPADRLNGQPRLTIEITGSGSNTIPYEGSLVLSVMLRNDGNENLVGILSLVGEGAADLSPGWTAAGGSASPTYDLQPGEMATYELTLVSSYLTAAGSRTVHVQAAGAGHQVNSESFEVQASSPAMPPDGISLGILKLDNQTSVTALAAGWLLAILLILIMVVLRKARKKEDGSEWEDAASELALPEPPQPEPKTASAPALADGEARMVDGRVTCVGCEASLKMPSSRTPPFRFKCPKCSEQVRVVE